MTTLISAIKASVQEQDKHSALVNCIEGWDGSIDASTILGGIQDRFAAMGKEPIPLAIQRIDLNSIKIVSPKWTVFDFIKLKNIPLVSADYATKFQLEDGDWCFVTCNKLSCFHQSEVKAMANWLFSNFHH